MNVIVEVGTAKVNTAAATAVCLVTYVVPSVLTLAISEAVPTPASVPSISGTSISAVAPDYNFEGGTLAHAA